MRHSATKSSAMVLSWGLCHYLGTLEDDIVENAVVDSTSPYLIGLNTPIPLYTPQVPQVPQSKRLDVYIEGMNVTEAKGSSNLIVVTLPLTVMMPMTGKAAAGYFPVLETCAAYITKIVSQLALYNPELLYTYYGKSYQETWKTYVQQVDGWTSVRGWGNVPLNQGGSQLECGWVTTTYVITVTQATLG